MSSNAYRAYVILLVSLMTVLPFTLGAIDSIAQPNVARALTSNSAGATAAMLAGIVLSSIVLLGSARGPVVGPPFQISVQVTATKPRSRSLAPALFKSALGAVLIILYLSGVLILGLVRAGTISPALASGLMFAAFSFAIVFVALWLAGQVSGHRSWSFAWLPLIIGVFAPPKTATLVGLYCAGAIAFAVFPRLLNALFGPAVIAQSQRWHSARTSLYIGDTTGAFALYGPRPRRGRRWNAVVVRPTWRRVFFADLIGATRTPGVLILSLVGLFSGLGFLLFGASVSSGWGTAAAAGGMILGYFALGPLTARFKYVASLRDNPPLFRFTTSQLYALHAIFPAAIGLTLSVIVAVVVPWDFSSLWTAPRTALIAFSILLGLRRYSSAKRELPLLLLTPIESPVGDLSSLNVLLWQADAVLLAGVTGAVLALI
ncbi:MAG TPA: hypothetical protein VK030_07725 [Actinomycetales bacterium]|nr:hypothetical protein [Actinomycetales bacterium]